MADLQATQIQGQLDVSLDAIVQGEVVENTGGADRTAVNPLRVGQTYSVPGEVVETTGTGSGGGFIPPTKQKSLLVSSILLLMETVT